MLDGVLIVVATAVLVAVVLTHLHAAPPSFSDELRQLHHRRATLLEAVENMTAVLSDTLNILQSVGETVERAGLKTFHEDDEAWQDAVAQASRAASATFRDSVADVVASVEAVRTELLGLPFKKS